MNLAARLGIAAGLLGALGAAIAYLASGPAGAGGAQSAAAARWESAAQCRDCHADVFAEWQGSHHQIAYTNPEVQKLSDDFRKEECMDCHLPRPLAVTGFGRRTLPRRTHLDEGVSCISCHLGPDGGLLARHDRPDAPCRPRADAAFLAVDACASCHNQHQTTDQWRLSPQAQQGVTCLDCHMPVVARQRADGSTREGRGHVYAGAHDPATLRAAGSFTAARDGSDLVLTLRNAGAGHNLPTEERHRAVDIVYRFLTAAGPTPWTRAFRFRQPYRDEPGENTQLPAGQQRTLRVPIPAGAAGAEARLWYRLTPFCGDDDPRSTLLCERRLDWP